MTSEGLDTVALVGTPLAGGDLMDHATSRAEYVELAVAPVLSRKDTGVCNSGGLAEYSLPTPVACAVC